MKTITLNEMTKILDDTLSDLKSGKIKNVNLVFYGEDGIGRISVIKQWIHEHADEITCVQLGMSNVTGEIENEVGEEAVTEEPIYGIDALDYDCGESSYLYEDDENDKLVHSYIIIDVNHARWGWDVAKRVKIYSELFKDRKYSSPVCRKIFDLHNVGLIIATAAIKGHSCGSIAPIPEIEKCSKVYNVFPSVEEFKAYFDEQTTTGKYKDEDKLKIEVFKKVLSSPHFKFISTKYSNFTPYRFIQWFEECKPGSDEEIMSQILSNAEDDLCDEVWPMFSEIALQLGYAVEEVAF